jgi:hypothetical protein
MHESYTLTLAFIDYFILAFTSIGLFFVSKTIYQRSHSAGQTSFFGSLLAIIGAISGITSKLLVSFDNSNYLFLESLLWLFQGPGFTLIFAATLQWSLHASHKAPKVLPILMATIVLAASLWMDGSLPENQLSFYILLAATVIFFSGTLIVFAGYCITQKLYLASTLLIISLSTNLVIQLSTPAFDFIVKIPFLPQGVSALTQLFFALGMWFIYKADLESQKMPH